MAAETLAQHRMQAMKWLGSIAVACLMLPPAALVFSRFLRSISSCPNKSFGIPQSDGEACMILGIEAWPIIYQSAILGLYSLYTVPALLILLPALFVTWWWRRKAS